jgi:hypothetical protein
MSVLAPQARPLGAHVLYNPVEAQEGSQQSGIHLHGGEEGVIGMVRRRLQLTISDKTKKPVIDIVGHGKDAYAWIGDGREHGVCLGFVSVSRLKAFLAAIE